MTAGVRCTQTSGIALFKYIAPSLIVWLVYIHPADCQVLLDAAPRQPMDKDASQQASLVLDTGGFRQGVECLAFSSSGRHLAAAAGHEVRIWDTATGEAKTTIRGYRDRNEHGHCFVVAFSPDDQHLLVGVQDYADHGSIRIYRTSDFKLSGLLPGLGAPCRQLAFTRDGKYLAAASDAGGICFWRWGDRQKTGSVEPANVKQPLFDAFAIPAADWALLVKYQGKAEPEILSMPLGKPVAADSYLWRDSRAWFADMSRAQFPNSGNLNRVALRLERQIWLASGSSKIDNAPHYWAAAYASGKSQPKAVYDKHRHLVTAIALNPESGLAASADLLGEVHVWELDSGRRKYAFKSCGEPFYEARFGRFDDEEQEVAFGTHELLTPKEMNQFGKLERVFSFARRAERPLEGTWGPDEVTHRQGTTLGVESRPGNYFMTCRGRGSGFKDYRIRAGAEPTTWTFLEPGALDLDFPVLVGDDCGLLVCYDPKRDVDRRYFIGHDTFITSSASSADGQLVLTGSTDRTLRIWALDDFQSRGHLDCKVLSHSVIEVKPGSQSARAGLQVDDKILSIDGMDFSALSDALLAGTYPFVPDQQVTVEISRGGRKLTKRVTLHEENDVSEPLLSLFLAEDGRWIVWTPQGYYDASPGADSLLGWHVNQGPDKDGIYYPVDVFQKQLYRPDIINAVLRTRNVPRAIREVSLARGGQANPLDLRDGKRMAQIAPPSVVVKSENMAPDEAGKLTVRATLRSENDLSAQQAFILLNGTPIKAELHAGPTPREREIRQEIKLAPGHNEIKIIGSNEASRTPITPVGTVHFKPAGPKREIRPNLYGVAIGIREYKNQELNLRFASQDAHDFADALRRQEGTLYAKVELRVLTDAEATREKMLLALDWQLTNMTADDVAVIFISAHGFRDNQKNFFLATHDVNPQSLRATALSDHDFLQIVQSMPGKRLVFVDTCHSGGITGAKGPEDSQPFADLIRDLVAPEYGAILFCSCTPREQSQEDASWGHGAFTKALLDTLSDPESDLPPEKDQHLWVTELEHNIAHRVKSLTRGQQHPVTQKSSEIRDFPVFRLNL